MEYLNDRPTKKQKLFQVSRIFAKNIVVKYYWKEEYFERTKKATYIIKGNGDAILELNDDYFRGKTKSTKRKLSDRNLFDKKYQSLLEILNTTDPEKFKQFLTTKAKYLFTMQVEKISFDIQIGQYQFCYKYNMDPVATVLDPDDVHEAISDCEEVDLNNLSNDMIQRLKCALCADQIKSLFSEIYYDYQVVDSITIRYVSDSTEYDDWNLTLDDSGFIKGWLLLYIESYTRDDLQNNAIIQYRPSQVKNIFVALREYHRTVLQESGSDQNKSNRGDYDSVSVKLKLGGIEYKYQQLTSDEMTQLMEILKPVAAPVAEKMLVDVPDGNELSWNLP